MYVYLCVKAKGSLYVFKIMFSHVIFLTESLLNLELIILLDWLATELQGPACLYLF